MSRKEKLFKKLMDRKQGNNMRFQEVLQVLGYLGFSVRNHSGSHFVGSLEQYREIVTLQPNENGKAKGYQLDQLRAMIKTYNLKIKP